MTEKRSPQKAKTAQPFKHQLKRVLAEQALVQTQNRLLKEAAAQKALAQHHELKQQSAEQRAFEAAMLDVSPLPAAVARVPAAQRDKPNLPTSDELALAELRNIVSGQAPFAVHESEEALYGAAPGVSHLLLDQLRRGQFAYQHHVDLHGLTRDAAHLHVAHFIAQSRRQSERCVLVVTGRGRSSPDGLSVLRNALPRWLTRAPIRPHVLAFSTARAHDGGAGAFYVLLRRPGVPPFGTGL